MINRDGVCFTYAAQRRPEIPLGSARVTTFPAYVRLKPGYFSSARFRDTTHRSEQNYAKLKSLCA